MTVKVSPKEATRLIAKYLKAKLVPYLKGSPGMGKSDIIHQIAAQYNLFVIDIRLSQCDPTDMLGFPRITGEGIHARAGYVPMDTFPLVGQELPIKVDEDGNTLWTGKDDEFGKPIPQRYSGWLIFFDELPSASTAVQAAAYKPILDKAIGLWKLHKNVAMCCAGNKDTDNAIVNPMSTAMQSRLVHLELVVSTDDWLDHAVEKKYDNRIINYIGFVPGDLYTFKPDHTDDTYACGRTWKFVDDILKATDEGDTDRRNLIGGAVTDGVASQFMAHMEIHDQLDKISDIVKSPLMVRIPEEPSIIYAMTGAVAHHIKDDNAEALCKYISRFPKEFQVVTLRDIMRRHPHMTQNKHIMAWVIASAIELY